MEEKKDILENLYIHLAAYKRKLGIEMEEIEVEMEKVEKALGVSHPEVIKLRIAGRLLIESEEGSK